MDTLFRWIHLSDIHTGHGDRAYGWDQSLVLDEIVRDIALQRGKAAEPSIDAILVTGDSDFLPAIRAAKNEGVLVHLFHGTGPQQPHKDLWDEVDERTIITPDLLQHFLL